MIAVAPRGRRAVGQHSSATFEWGSPDLIVSRGRDVIGPFDVDPASSPHWNRVVRAKRIITEREDGTRTPWVPGAPAPAEIAAQRSRAKRPDRFTAWVNPPNTGDGELVALYWRALTGYFELGWITSAIWVGFSVEQLSRLQRVNAPSDPLDHTRCIPARRIKYRSQTIVKSQPGHASYIALLTYDPREVVRFVKRFSDLGRVVRGERWP